ncbi:MAG: Mur ligase family protein [Marinifilaceae bacterium]|jgi:UDP-N-acetylmuramate: L-alanyl-gamma-D-glutamyl-meso-diaminopimelate ligase|nr:Mur ligase family protein [Marinifilaceae bacterium]
MRVHFIAIGGAVMHNLAIALYKKGYNVTGSDDEIFEPSRSNLKKYNLLPNYKAWNADIINSDIDAVILGMHAREDNPELLKAKELNLKIYSFPEYLYEQTKNKKRIVIGGSHGKTSTTSMLMHILKSIDYEFDYMVGSSIDGFETMVGLSDSTSIAVFEGDEYLSSALDLRPKFHLYKPDIAVLTGIAWDHINVFPSFEIYKKQFEIFIDCIKPGGSLIYFEEDKNILDIIESKRSDIDYIPYKAINHNKSDLETCLVDSENKHHSLKIFGKHNMENLSAVQNITNLLGIDESLFMQTISQFKGSAKRMQEIYSDKDTIVYRDFAHSPSKLKATVDAVYNQYQDRSIIAFMELHTFSSLTEDFIPHYKSSMLNADKAIVYFDKNTLKHKKLPDLDKSFVEECFGGTNLQVFDSKEELKSCLKELNYKNSCTLIMSSGNFSGIDFLKYIT